MRALLAIVVLLACPSPALAQDPPTITDVQPRHVTAPGTIEIHGTGFTVGLRVMVGGATYRPHMVSERGRAWLRLPALSSGTWRVRVSNDGATWSEPFEIPIRDRASLRPVGLSVTVTADAGEWLVECRGRLSADFDFLRETPMVMGALTLRPGDVRGDVAVAAPDGFLVRFGPYPRPLPPGKYPLEVTLSEGGEPAREILDVPWPEGRTLTALRLREAADTTQLLRRELERLFAVEARAALTRAGTVDDVAWESLLARTIRSQSLDHLRAASSTRGPLERWAREELEAELDPLDRELRPFVDGYLFPPYEELPAIVHTIDGLSWVAKESAAVLAALRTAKPDEIPALFDRAEKAWTSLRP